MADMAEWQNGRMEEWQNGGNGGRNGRMADRMAEQREWRNGGNS